MTEQPARTVQELVTAIENRLSDAYDLVYLSYDDKLTDEQIAALVRCDPEKFDAGFEEWQWDAAYDGAEAVLKDLTTEVISDWEAEDEEDYTELRDELEAADDWTELNHTIQERDNGDWLKTLVNNSGDVLLRLTALDEDHGFAFQAVEPIEVMERLNVEDKPEDKQYNLGVIEDVLNECSPEFSVLMGYWVAGVSVRDLYDLTWDADALVEITDPHLYLGNPFAGSGWLSEEPIHTTIRVRRGDLRTDADAFGYALDEVYGGLTPSSFEAEIKAVQTADN